VCVSSDRKKDKLLQRVKVKLEPVHPYMKQTSLSKNILVLY